MQKVNPQTGLPIPFLKEKVKKMCFSRALMPVEALNMPGAVFPLAHRLKHVQGRIMQKVDPQNERPSPFLWENVKKMCFSCALIPVEALNMPDAVFPLAHRLKYV